MCVLNEGDRRDEGSLLADDDTAPWFTRGVFTPDQLAGTCSADRDFGHQRTFNVRGITLTLTATALKSDRKGVRAFTLMVSAQPDENALARADAAAPMVAEALSNRCQSTRTTRQ